MTEEAIREYSEAAKALKAKVDKGIVDTAEFKEFEEKVNTELDKYEDAAQKSFLEAENLKKENKQLQERMEELELSVVQSSAKAHAKDYKQTEEYKALNEYARRGDTALAPEQKQLLRTDDNTSGGYLTMSEMDDTIVKQITEISPIRQLARVKTVSSKTLSVPTRTGLVNAAYEGEAEESQTDTSDYGSESLTVFRLTATVPFTLDLLMDSKFDLESEITSDIAESFAFREGNRFVLGNNVRQPEGFLTNSGVLANAYTSAGTDLSGDDLIELTGRLKVGYNGMFGFNRQTRAQIRKLKGTDGHYLWTPSLAQGEPPMIAGEPYMVLQDMPEIAAANYPIIYGDFSRAYTIIDMAGMSVVRDDLTRKKDAIVELTFHKYNYGKVILSEALIPLLMRT